MPRASPYLSLTVLPLQSVGTYLLGTVPTAPRQDSGSTAYPAALFPVVFLAPSSSVLDLSALPKLPAEQMPRY
ncbi:hypothetical protein F5B22DRAFT_592683 [Xylaria bambusicola]|uniref:uncharacterized protein n=1 Tax=Xylaria bambusicola TaxID=326684 RepID=UPI0020079341|nr:uncharacterized protein F5B22DRAFT_592683 [Xylaria bambusicola]KAI0522063.1 hypothetical protein F5B22DRAFT_592683 [Xylaria bambusicola]